jgi:hypothetical protein
MPGARIEITQLLVLHLVELGVELYHPVVGVAVEGRDVVAGPEPHRPPDDRDFPLPEQVAGVLQMREVLQLEGDVMHVDVLAGDEVHRVVVGVAAHEHEEIADPVGHSKAQHLCIELGHRLGVVHGEGNVAKFERADAADRLAVADEGPFVEQLDHGAFGIGERQQFGRARDGIAAQLRVHAVAGQHFLQIGQIGVRCDLK